MIQKVSTKTQNLDNTKITSIIHYRNGELSDATRIYRRQEILKKKLKGVLDINSNLQREIKNHENQIKDQRASIIFQLNDLTKQMSSKFSLFVEQKLQKVQFKTNQVSHQSIQKMMQKYEKIQKQSQMLKGIYELSDNMNKEYEKHSKNVEQLVMNLEQNNKQYEQKMQKLLSDINEEIKDKIQDNLNIEFRTQQAIKDIDRFEVEVLNLKEQQAKIIERIDKVKKMVFKKQQKVQEIKQWAQIVIDKNNRKNVYKTIREKQNYFQKLKASNNQLQIYLYELENQQKQLALRQFQNFRGQVNLLEKENCKKLMQKEKKFQKR